MQRRGGDTPAPAHARWHRLQHAVLSNAWRGRHGAGPPGCHGAPSMLPKAAAWTRYTVYKPH